MPRQKALKQNMWEIIRLKVMMLGQWFSRFLLFFQLENSVMKRKQQLHFLVTHFQQPELSNAKCVSTFTLLL